MWGQGEWGLNVSSSEQTWLEQGATVRSVAARLRLAASGRDGSDVSWFSARAQERCRGKERSRPSINPQSMESVEREL